MNEKRWRRCLVAGLMLAAAIAQAAAATPPPPGASSCSGCHAPTAGPAAGAPRLVGRNPADIFAAMSAFRSGQRAATVMDRIAKGFSDAEVEAIAAWYGAQQ